MSAFASCLDKQQELIAIFSSCKNQEEKYEKIIAFGKKLAPMDPSKKNEIYLVKGCQSLVYLSSSLKEGLMHFEAASDAMISAGLASLLLFVYNEEPPEVVLKCPPDYLEKIGIQSSLTPNRANGLYSMHLKMKQDALKLLIEQNQERIA